MKIEISTNHLSCLFDFEWECQYCKHFTRYEKDINRGNCMLNEASRNHPEYPDNSLHVSTPACHRFEELDIARGLLDKILNGLSRGEIIWEAKKTKQKKS